MPAEAEEKIEEYMAELNEQVAETDEALMEKFFMEEPFTAEELLTGIKAGIRDRSRHAGLLRLRYDTGLGTIEPAGQPRQVRSQPPRGQAHDRRLTRTANEVEFKLDPKGSPMVVRVQHRC